MTWTHTFHCWPPSVNHTYGIARNRIYLKAPAKLFREMVAGEMLVARHEGTMPQETLNGSLAVVLRFVAPDRKKRDVDNLLKATLDALTACELWKDDKLIDDLRVIKTVGSEKHGSFCLEVSEL